MNNKANSSINYKAGTKRYEVDRIKVNNLPRELQSIGTLIDEGRVDNNLSSSYQANKIIETSQKSSEHICNGIELLKENINKNSTDLKSIIELQSLVEKHFESLENVVNDGWQTLGKSLEDDVQTLGKSLKDDVQTLGKSLTDVVKGELQTLVKGELQTLVKGELQTLVKGELQTLVKGELQTLVKGELQTLGESLLQKLIEKQRYATVKPFTATLHFKSEDECDTHSNQIIDSKKQSVQAKRLQDNQFRSLSNENGDNTSLSKEPDDTYAGSPNKKNRWGPIQSKPDFSKPTQSNKSQVQTPPFKRTLISQNPNESTPCNRLMRNDLRLMRNDADLFDSSSDDDKPTQSNKGKRLFSDIDLCNDDDEPLRYLSTTKKLKLTDSIEVTTSTKIEERFKEASQIIERAILSNKNLPYYKESAIKNSGRCCYCILSKEGPSHRQYVCNWNPSFRKNNENIKMFCKKCGFLKDKKRGLKYNVDCSPHSINCITRQKVLQMLKPKYGKQLQTIGFDLKSNLFTSIYKEL